MADEAGGPVAAIDCGTNSTRLLVVDPQGDTLARLMRITRLGQGVDATHVLDTAAIERTVGVLAEFRAALDGAGAVRTRMVATSAVRDAANGQEFLDAASRVVGTPAELLSGDEEGRLAYAGATADLPPVAGDDVVVDIGGGSTELVVGRHGKVDAVSLDIGCVRVTERFLRDDPPSGPQIARARAAIAAELDRAQAQLPVLGTRGAERRLIGLAGTVSTLSALDQGIVEYDRLTGSTTRSWGGPPSTGGATSWLPSRLRRGAVAPGWSPGART